MSKDKVTAWVKAKPAPKGASNGESYDNFMGRWSKLVAPEFVGWLGVERDKRWLDLGCGTGVLTRAILESASPTLVRGIDPTEDYIAYARDNFIADSRASFSNGGHQDLHSLGETFDVVVAGLMLNFADNPEDAVSAMRSVAVDNGVIGAYVWDYNQKMDALRHFWEAVVELDSNASPFHESRRFKINDFRALEQFFQTAGVRDIETHAIEVSIVYSSFDEYWIPFSGGQGPAGVYFTSLDKSKRVELEKIMKQRIITDSNGAFKLEARAMAIKGRK